MLHIGLRRTTGGYTVLNLLKDRNVIRNVLARNLKKLTLAHDFEVSLDDRKTRKLGSLANAMSRGLYACLLALDFVLAFPTVEQHLGQRQGCFIAPHIFRVVAVETAACSRVIAVFKTCIGAHID